jgi:single-strand DNA-binding protein
MSLYASGNVRVLTDPDVKFFESGLSVVKFLGGLNEGKDKDGNYINNSIEVEAWNKTGEVIVNYAPKGSTIFVSGNIRQEEWDDKDTGAKRRKHVLKAGRIELLPKSGDGTAAAPAAAAPAASAPAATGEFIPF